MLEAIRGARDTINMECYIFTKGEAARSCSSAALAERARAGVRVTLVLDAIGSLGAFFVIGEHTEGRGLPGAALSAAHLVRPGATEQPHPPRAAHRRRPRRVRRRRRRRRLVAEADHGKPAWRDMMARIEGPIVASIQGVFAENWLECCGEILVGPEYLQAARAGRRPAPRSRSRARPPIARPYHASSFRP